MMATWTTSLVPRDPSALTATPWGAFVNFGCGSGDFISPCSVCGAFSAAGACFCKPANVVAHAGEHRSPGSHFPPMPLLIVVVDDNFCRREGAMVSTAIDEALADVPPTTLVALLTFNRTVHVYHLAGLVAPVRASVFSGNAVAALSAADIDELQHIASSTVLPLSLAAPQLKSEFVFASDDAHDPPGVPCSRAVGLTLEIAMQLCLQHRARCAADAVSYGRAVLISGGPPTIGRIYCVADISSANSGSSGLGWTSDVRWGPRLPHQAAAEHLATLLDQLADFGRAAGKAALQLNFVLLGHAQINVTGWSALATLSGGRLVVRAEYSDTSLARDVHELLSAPVALSPVIIVQVPDASGIRVSSILWRGLQSTGPDMASLVLPNAQLERDWAAVTFCTHPHTNGGATVAAAAAAMAAAAVLPVQFRLSFNDSITGERVTRVVTSVVATAASSSSLFDALRAPYTVALTARTVLVSRDVLDHASPSVLRVLTTIKAECSFSNGRLPESLAALPQLLHHLHRGTMLGSLLQHPDDILAERVVFLSAGPDASKRMIFPDFYEVMGPSEAELLPLSLTQASLRSTRVCVMDAQTHIYVWVGSDVPKDSPCLEFANLVAEKCGSDRFPAPFILTVGQRESMARWVLCRLEPAKVVYKF